MWGCYGEFISIWETTSVNINQGINLSIIILLCINKTVRSLSQTILGCKTYIHHSRKKSSSTTSLSHMDIL